MANPKSWKFIPFQPAGLNKRGNESKQGGMMEKVRRKRREKTEAEREQESRRKKWEQLFNKRKKGRTDVRTTAINLERFFLFPKFIGSTVIHSLSKSALAIYPVFCSLADFERNDWFYVSQEELAKMSGIGLRHVREGLEELMDKTLLKRKKVTEGKMHYYIYKVWFVRRGMIDDMKHDSFIFHTCIIKSGVWAKLTLRAKALYLAMRSKARFDIVTYCELELDTTDYHEYAHDLHGETYRNRRWDVCSETITDLCKLAGISNQNLRPVLLQLQRNDLFGRYGNQIIVGLKAME